MSPCLHSIVGPSNRPLSFGVLFDPMVDFLEERSHIGWLFKRSSILILVTSASTGGRQFLIAYNGRGRLGSIYHMSDVNVDTKR